MRRPGIDVDELVPEPVGMAGEVDVDGVRVDGGDLTGASGDGRVAHALFTAVTMAGSQLGPLELSDVRFDGTELSNSSWQPVTARRVEFVGCRALGWRLNLTQAHDVYLHDCRLDYAVLTIAKVKGLLVFVDCSFPGAVLTGDLSTVVFSGCDFDGAEFDATRAVGCDLRTSQLTGARGLLSLRGATLDLAQAMAIGPRLAVEAGLVVLD
jgi:uncharacterized protein YjbI with pentapeptide repeats